MVELFNLLKKSSTKLESRLESAREIYHGSSPPKIALIQPDSPGLLIPNSFPGLGLLYVSAHLRNHGYESSFYDLTTKGNDLTPNGKNIGDEIYKFDIYGFSSSITQFRDAERMMKQLKEKNPNALYVVGGPFPSRSPKYGLDAGFDVVGRGEGEDVMLEVANNFPNIKKGEISAKNFPDPNFLPDWGAINPLEYIYQLDGKRCINIMTKRGNCPFHCTFCALQNEGVSKLRMRTIDNIVEEANFLRERYGFGSLAIYDDEVLVTKKRDHELFKKLKEIDMPYRCMTRANLADRSDIELLKATGCGEICIGLESADPFIHEVVVEKETTIEHHTQFLRNAKDVGLRTKVYLIIGLPSESRRTIENTKQWLRKTRPENFDISIFTPYPGAPIFENKRHYEIDWDQEKLEEIWFSGAAQYDQCAVWTPHLSSEDILEIKQEIEHEFARGKGGTTDYWGPCTS